MSFLKCFLPDHITELKCDHLYGGLPKRLKAMVAYLKASTNEKMYSDYLWEAKLKFDQPTKTPAAWVAHLKEEDADKEECTDSEDPDGMEDVTKEFIACFARAVKDTQWEEKCCYHCSSPDHFIRACLLVAASRTGSHLNEKEGMAPLKGALTLPGKATMPKEPQDSMPKA